VQGVVQDIWCVVFFVLHACKEDEEVSQVLVPGYPVAFVCVERIKKAKCDCISSRLLQVRQDVVATIDCFSTHLTASS